MTKRTQRTSLVLSSVTAIFIGLVLSVTSCGKGSSDEDEQLDPTGSSGTGYLNVNGVAGFGAHCPQGSITPVHPVRLQLWDCPIGSGTVELAEPIKPIFFTVDCKNRLIGARTNDKSIDTTWQMLPDNSFVFTLDGNNSLKAKLVSDGAAGDQNCTAMLSTDFMGKVDCTDPDKAVISFEAVMWANRPPEAGPSNRPSPIVTGSPIPTSSPVPTVTPSGTPQPSPNPSPSIPAPPATHPSPLPFPTHFVRATVSGTPPTNLCKMPSSCYFYTTTQLQQCR